MDASTESDRWTHAIEGIAVEAGIVAAIKESGRTAAKGQLIGQDIQSLIATEIVDADATTIATVSKADHMGIPSPVTSASDVDHVRGHHPVLVRDHLIPTKPRRNADTGTDHNLHVNLIGNMKVEEHLEKPSDAHQYFIRTPIPSRQSSAPSHQT
jgi:hypothetical protein